MKTLLEQDDIQAIASAVVEMLKPMLSGNGKGEVEDTVFDKKGLSEYLKVSVSTIDKLVSNKEIPYFKIQPGQSGAVRFRQRDIDKWIQRQTIPDYNPFRGNVTT
jgi:excisionase family DNA binding protein